MDRTDLSYDRKKMVKFCRNGYELLGLQGLGIILDWLLNNFAPRIGLGCKINNKSTQPVTPLWSSGQSFWLQIQRSQVLFPALPDFLQWVWNGVHSAS